MIRLRSNYPFFTQNCSKSSTKYRVFSEGVTQINFIPISIDFDHFPMNGYSNFFRGTQNVKGTQNLT